MNGLPPVIKREDVIYHKPIDYEKAWKYLRRKLREDSHYDCLAIMLQIEAGTIEIE